MPSKPRRQRGEGGLYLRADGMWVGAVDLGYVNGRRRRQTVSSKSFVVAQRKLSALRRTVADHGTAPGARLTVQEWLIYWLTDVADVKPRTMQGYRTTVNQHLIPHIGRRRLDQLEQQHIRAMHKALEKQGLSAGTVVKAHRVLAKALTDAMREGKVVRNVADKDHMDSPRAAPNSRGALTVAQAKTILQLRDARWGAALLLGARQGEALGLQWDRVNLEEGWADLSWQLQRLGYVKGTKELDVPRGFEFQQLDGGLCLTRPKSRAGQRVIPLPTAMIDMLRAHPRVEGPHGLVFVREGGRPWDPSPDSKAWHAMLDAAGLPSVPLHAARHTTATLLREAGVDPEMIRAILGHNSLVVTREYVHTSRALMSEAMGRLGDLLSLEARQEPVQVLDQLGADQAGVEDQQETEPPPH